MGKKSREEQTLYPYGKGRKLTAAELAAAEAAGAAAAPAADGGDAPPRAAGSFDVDAVIDEMLEDSAETRITATRKLSEHLRLKYDPELLEHAMDTTKQAFKKNLKKGTTAEVLETLKCIQMVVVTLGSDSNEFYLNMVPVIKPLLQGDANATVVAEVLSTLALLTFIGAPEEDDTLTAIDLIGQFLDARAPGVVVASLRALALLTSIVAPDVIIKKLFAGTLPKLEKLLESSTPDILVASGDLIALMFDMWRDAAELDNVEFNIKDCTVVDVSALCGRLRQLSQSVSHANARQQRIWRLSLRRVAAHVRAVIGSEDNNADDEDDDEDNDEEDDEDEEPESEEAFALRKSGAVVNDVIVEHVVVQGKTIAIEGFASIAQLNALRHALAGGFLHHIECNSLLHDVFDIDLKRLPAPRALSHLEKRAVMSPNSKASKTRDANVERERTTKLARSTQGLTRDDDDDE